MDLFQEIDFSSKKECTDWMFNDYETHKMATKLLITSIKLFISIVVSLLPITDIFRHDVSVNICIFVKREEKKMFRFFYNIFCCKLICLFYVFKDRIF